VEIVHADPAQGTALRDVHLITWELTYRDRAAESWYGERQFAGRHGTVASKSSLKDEKQVALHPQSLGEEIEKVREESDDEPGLLGTAKKVLQEADRQVSGEYEHREDVEAEGNPRERPTNE
jgi:hypothetical protein